MKSVQEIIDSHDSDLYVDGSVHSESGYSYKLVLKMLEEMRDQYTISDISELRILKLHHPQYGYDYWNEGMYENIELPDGTFIDLQSQLKYKNQSNYRIYFKDGNLLLKEYICSSGFGRTTDDRFPEVLLVKKNQFDVVQYVEFTL